MLWNPNQYLKFADARLRPAMDLVNRAAVYFAVNGNGQGPSSDHHQVKRVLDLGCGPGNLTELLCSKFPYATVLGVDSSAEMIEKAIRQGQQSLPADILSRVSYRCEKIETLASSSHKEPSVSLLGRDVDDNSSSMYDLVFSNAALHWCVDHEELFPNILKNLVNPNGGVLAVQIPDTMHQPSHVLMNTAIFRSGMLDKTGHVRIPRCEHDALWYYQLLSPLVKEIDMWNCEYTHQLPTQAPNNYADSHDSSVLRHPVLEWTKSTGLMPIIEALGGEASRDCQAYLDEYDRLLNEAYPIVKLQNKYHSQGIYVTILTYRRFFLTCKL